MSKSQTPTKQELQERLIQVEVENVILRQAIEYTDKQAYYLQQQVEELSKIVEEQNKKLRELSNNDE